MALEIFDLAVNIFQSIFVSYYLVECLEVKNKNINKIITYMTGFMVTLVYLEIIRYKTDFESFGIFIYLFISMMFSIVMLGGTIAEKAFYNILLLGIIVFSAIMGTGVIGLIARKDNMIIVSDTGIYYVMACMTAQVCLVLFAIYIIKIKKKFAKIQDTRYMLVASVIPLISVAVCCFILYNDYQNYNIRMMFTLLAMLGIIILNIISFILMIFEHKVYNEKIRSEVLIEAYRQKEYDVEQIKQLKNETDKTRHEVQKIMLLLDELISDKKYDKAAVFLDEFIKDKNLKQEQMVYTDNIILNYLLNRKLEQCLTSGINMHCFVSGVIDGIKDVDLYVLVGNLLDNAIEAAIKTDEKRAEIRIYADEKSIRLEIGNSTDNDVFKNNPLFKTTKADGSMHGYGINNIMDTVKKYDGIIKYKMKLKNVMVCNVVIAKKSDGNNEKKEQDIMEKC